MRFSVDADRALHDGDLRRVGRPHAPQARARAVQPAPRRPPAGLVLGGRLDPQHAAGSTLVDDRLVVVVEGDGKKGGLLVDELLGQQQVVIKSLETNFRRVDGLSGATILGDGTVALIIDVDGVVRLSANGGHVASKQVAAA